MAKVKVKKGQVWRSKDSRDDGREVEVMRVDPDGYALIKTLRIRRWDLIPK